MFQKEATLGAEWVCSPQSEQEALHQLFSQL